MLGTKPPTARECRLEWWQRQITRQQSGGLSVAVFCRQLGVTVRQFHYWRDCVERASRPNSCRSAAAQSPRNGRSASGVGVTNFLPVSIVHADDKTELAVELSNACVIRLRGTIDPHLLQVAILAAGELGGPGQGA